MRRGSSRERIVDWLINNILTIISLLVPIFPIIYKAMFGYLYYWTLMEIVLLGALILESAMLLIWIIWNKVSYKSYRYPWSKISTNYTVISKHLFYTINDHDELSFSRTTKIKSHINNLESVFDKFIWTGRVEAGLPERGEHIRSIDQQSLIGIWKYFRITLEEHLSKGEEVTISYAWPRILDCKSASPFFSSSTDEPTKELIFTLKLGSRYAGQEIRLEEFRAIEADNPITVEVANLDLNGDYTWNVKKVKRFRYYRVRWSWERGASAIPDVHDR